MTSPSYDLGSESAGGKDVRDVVVVAIAGGRLVGVLELTVTT